MGYEGRYGSSLDRSQTNRWTIGWTLDCVLMRRSFFMLNNISNKSVKHFSMYPKNDWISL